MFKKIQTILAVMMCVCLSGCAGSTANGSEPQELQTVTEEKTAGNGKNATEVKAVKNESDDVRIPEIQVSFGDPSLEIPSMAGGYTLVKSVEPTYGSRETEPQKQTMIACGSDPLLSLANDAKMIPYVRLGSAVNVQFRNGTTPDSVTIEDIILNENGSAKYGADTILVATPDVAGDGLELNLDVNMNALFSSDSETYQKGGVLRGFRMSCEWDNGSTAEYAWILKTDAAWGADGKTAGAYLVSGCGMGIPVFSDVRSVETDKEGYVVKFSLDNQLDDSYTYGDEFLLKRIEGKKSEEVACREETAWGDIEHILEGKQSTEIELPVGMMYGELEPGYYTIEKELTNSNTGEIYTVSSGFQVAE